MNASKPLRTLGVTLFMAAALMSSGCLESTAKDAPAPKAPVACEIVLAVSGMS